MGLLGRKGRSAFAIVSLAVILPVMSAQAADAGSVIDRIEEWQGEDYIELTEEGGAYEVCPGDCLWSIAEKLWGDGSLYGNLVTNNRKIIPDPDVIYPGTCLTIKRNVYIRKQNPYNRNAMWGYAFPTPSGSTVGIREFGDNGSNFCMSGNGVVACLVQDKKKEAVETTSDWTKCIERLERHAEVNYQDKISELAFEHYQSAEGEEIYLYSYQYQVDLSEYGRSDYVEVDVCVGMKLTEHLQAEFVGFDFDDGICDTVRSVTAGFEELPSDEPFSSVNDSNMSIWPANEWEMDGMYNAFAWIGDSFEYMTRKAMEKPEEQKESMMSKYPKR